MRHRHLGIVLATVLVLFAATAARAPYHTAPTPPSSPAQPEPPGAAAGAVTAEAKTAAAHASYASEGGSVAYVREHLGHTIVCIEGAKGKNVNAAWDNPCQGQGSGVLNDLRGPMAAWTLVAQTADSLAVAGMKSTDLARMKAAAKGVSALMQLIAEGR